MKIQEYLTTFAEYIKDNIIIEGYEPITTIVYKETDLDKYKNKVLLAAHHEGEVEYSELSNESLLASFNVDIDFIFQGMAEDELTDYQNTYFEAFLAMLRDRTLADYEFIVPIRSTFFDAVEGRQNCKALEFILKTSCEID